MALENGFQSTHPARGGTLLALMLYAVVDRISIHPPREGWDLVLLADGLQLFRFQSTHPARGGTKRLDAPARLILFQSTHPARGGTLRRPAMAAPVYISIHPPREGWDPSPFRCASS